VNKAIKWVVLVLVLAGAGWFFFVRDTAPAEAPRQSLTTAPAERRDISISAEATGVLEPIRTVEVKSRASGEVLKVAAQTGDKVTAGSLLAEIDPRDVENAYQQAVADLEAARVKASTSGAQRKRLEALRQSGVITQQEFEAAYETAASAQAALVRAQTNLQLAKEQRADATIKAPIDGTIIERTVEPGVIIASATQNVSGGTTLFKMADLGAMQVRTSIDETDIGKVVPGQEVEVRVEAFQNRVFRGEVLKIEPQSVTEQSVTMFPVLVSIDNRRGFLMPGMNAEVTIKVADAKNALTVPVGAVVSMRQARTTARLFGVPDEAMTEVLRRPDRAGGDAVRDPEQAPGADGARAAPVAALPESEGAVLTRAARGVRGSGDGPSAGGAEAPAASEEAERSAATQRPGVVFVAQPDGTHQPRRVMVGLSDWDYAQVLSGLEEGERVGLVSAVQLNQSNQERNERMRQRMGGPMGAGGGGGGPRGPRR